MKLRARFWKTREAVSPVISAPRDIRITRSPPGDTRLRYLPPANGRSERLMRVTIPSQARSSRCG